MSGKISSRGRNRFGPLTRCRSCKVVRTTMVAFVACATTGVLSGCRDRIGIDDYTAVEIQKKEVRHPIRFAARGEALLIELAGKGQGLSRNQRADLHRFLSSYKAESRSRLTVATPRSYGGHLAAKYAVRDVMDVVAEAGIPERAVDVVRHTRGLDPEIGHAIEVAYDKQVAVAPECGHFPSDVTDLRERLLQENFGCAHQRNLALMVDTARDLQVPQPETPRSSERRSVTWSDYIKGESGGDGGDAMSVGGDDDNKNDPKPPKIQ